jgi:hypothetical protein
MKKTIILLLFFLGLGNISIAQNLRYIDSEIKLEHPYNGYSFTMPSDDSIGFWVINHGPDTMKPKDIMWLRIWKGIISLEPSIFISLSDFILPGDSMRFSSSIKLKYFQGDDEMDFCVWLRTYVAEANPDKIFYEEDSTEMFVNNKSCVKVNNHKNLSVENLSPPNQPILYPNPFSNVLHIQTEEVVSMQIYNISGVMLYEGREEALRTHHWPNGLYVAKMWLNDGTVVHKKILKTGD